LPKGRPRVGGFDRIIFADMLDTLSHFTDAEIPVSPDEVTILREFFTQWVCSGEGHPQVRRSSTVRNHLPRAEADRRIAGRRLSERAPRSGLVSA
jgi:hypothetical protein